MPFCTGCGAQIYPDARFCTSCGARAHVPESNVFIFALADDERDPNYAVDFFEVELVGESRHEEAFVNLLGKVADGEEKRLDDVMAILIPETEESSGRDAVAVHVLDPAMLYQKVGYLSRADTEEYLPTIKELERRTGRIVGCLAGVHAKGRTADNGRPTYAARVYLPEPDAWLTWRL